LAAPLGLPRGLLVLKGLPRGRILLLLLLKGLLLGLPRGLLLLLLGLPCGQRLGPVGLRLGLPRGLLVLKGLPRGLLLLLLLLKGLLLGLPRGLLLLVGLPCGQRLGPVGRPVHQRRDRDFGIRSLPRQHQQVEQVLVWNLRRRANAKMTRRRRRRKGNKRRRMRRRRRRRRRRRNIRHLGIARERGQAERQPLPLLQIADGDPRASNGG